MSRPLNLNSISISTFILTVSARSLISLWLVVQDCPVEDEVVLIALAEEYSLQQTPEVGVVGPILKTQAAAVVQVGRLGTKRLCPKDWEMGHGLSLETGRFGVGPVSSSLLPTDKSEYIVLRYKL